MANIDRLVVELRANTCLTRPCSGTEVLVYLRTVKEAVSRIRINLITIQTSSTNLSLRAWISIARLAINRAKTTRLIETIIELANWTIDTL